MTIETTNSTISYTGNNSVTVFAYDFLSYSAEHLFIYLDDVVQTVGFTISGIGVDTGGDITFSVAPGSGVDVRIDRTVPETQLIEYQEYGPFPAKTNERGLDLGVMASQQLQRTSDRNLSAKMDKQTAAAENNIVVFDSAGNSKDSGLPVFDGLGKMNKRVGAAENNLVVFDSAGDSKDSGIQVSSIATNDANNIKSTGGQNTMAQFLNMASNPLLNLPAPSSDTEPLRKGDIVTNATGATVQYVDDSTINSLTIAYEFPTVAAFKASSILFPDGKTITLLDRGADFTKISGTGTGNDKNIIASATVSQSIDLIIHNGVAQIEQWGAIGNNVFDNTAILQLISDDLSIGLILAGYGIFKSKTVNISAQQVWRGVNAQRTKFNFSIADPGTDGFLITGGLPNYAHGSGFYDMGFQNAPRHNFHVDATVGGGVGESFFMDRVQSDTAGEDGFRFNGDSTPLHLGRLSPHGNGGAGVNLISENQTHVQIMYIGGDNNDGGLCVIANPGSQANIHIVGWKSERREATGHTNIFEITNAQGGYVHIGSGRYSSQDAVAPNAVVKVTSGNSLFLDIDPVSSGDSLTTDYAFLLENLITNENYTIGKLGRKSFSNTQTYGGPISLNGTASAWSNSRNSMGAVQASNTLRFNHQADGAVAGTNTEFFNDATLIAKIASSGFMSLAVGVRIGGLTTEPVIISGTGSPEAVKSAVVGSMYMRSDGGAGTSFYVKESGTGNTGWVAK